RPGPPAHHARTPRPARSAGSHRPRAALAAPPARRSPAHPSECLPGRRSRRRLRRRQALEPRIGPVPLQLRRQPSRRARWPPDAPARAVARCRAAESQRGAVVRPRDGHRGRLAARGARRLPSRARPRSGTRDRPHQPRAPAARRGQPGRRRSPFSRGPAPRSRLRTRLVRPGRRARGRGACRRGAPMLRGRRAGGRHAGRCALEPEPALRARRTPPRGHPPSRDLSPSGARAAVSEPAHATEFLVGTSGFSYPAWRGPFYPEKLPAAGMLGFYAGVFPAVEINNTFYRMPAPALLTSWAGQTPVHFRFALKAPQQITHRLRLKEAAEPAREFIRRSEALEGKRGPLLFQLPP